MSDNMVEDLVQGVSRFTKLWKILLVIDLLGWFCAFIAGLTSLMALWWFAFWVIPLSVVLFVKATLSYFDSKVE